MKKNIKRTASAKEVNRRNFLLCGVMHPNTLLSVLTLHCKKRFAIFPSPAGMSLTKLSLGGNIPAQGEFSQ
jgi:hypothetical protein